MGLRFADFAWNVSVHRSNLNNKTLPVYLQNSCGTICFKLARKLQLEMLQAVRSLAM